MAERVETIPGYSPMGVSAKYPWDKWLDGSVWELAQGKDFDCEPGSMHSSAKSAARVRSIGVTVAVRGDHVYIQAKR